MRIYTACPHGDSGEPRNALAFLHSWGIEPEMGFDDQEGAHYLEFWAPPEWSPERLGEFTQALNGEVSLEKPKPKKKMLECRIYSSDEESDRGVVAFLREWDLEPVRFWDESRGRHFWGFTLSGWTERRKRKFRKALAEHASDILREWH